MIGKRQYIPAFLKLLRTLLFNECAQIAPFTVLVGAHVAYHVFCRKTRAISFGDENKIIT